MFWKSLSVPPAMVTMSWGTYFFTRRFGRAYLFHLQWSRCLAHRISLTRRFGRAYLFHLQWSRCLAHRISLTRRFGRAYLFHLQWSRCLGHRVSLPDVLEEPICFTYNGHDVLGNVFLYPTFEKGLSVPPTMVPMSCASYFFNPTFWKGLSVPPTMVTMSWGTYFFNPTFRDSVSASS